MLGRLRPRSDDAGFTFVELMTVVVIIGILAGIAVPLLMNNKRRGYQASLERTLRDAATAQEAKLAEGGNYAADVDGLHAEGFRATESVQMSVELVPGGYCIEATRPGAEQPLYITNSGPAAGRPTSEACR